MALETLGRYRIVRLLARGSTGHVYEAYDPQMDRQVALKVLPVSWLEPHEAAEYAALCIARATEAAPLKHPHIVECLGWGTDHGMAYLVTALAQGADLRAQLKTGQPLGLERSTELMQQLLTALQFAHKHGVVHGRIQPSNLMLGPDDHLSVAGFGGLTWADPDISGPLVPVDPGMRYRSPEQALGGTGDARSDLYSAAAVLYEMLTGTPPFTGGHEFFIKQRVLQEPPQAPSKHNPSLPVAVDAVLARALAKPPEQRYATAHDLLQALLQACEGPHATAPEAPRPAATLSDAARDPLLALVGGHGPLAARAGMPGRAPSAPTQEGAAPRDTAGLSRYRLIRPLGRGSMGTAYEAHDTVTGRGVALKTVKDVSPEELPWVVSCLRTEALVGRRLWHPNIAEMVDAGDTDSPHHVALELATGGSLKALLSPGQPLALERTLRIMQELLSALAHVHQHGVIHRDVKPANVMFDADGHVKLTDFGIAHVAGSSEASASLDALVGTPAWMSPEQLMGVPVDHRTDLFSAGIVLYQLLTGARPFTGANDFAVMQAIAQQPCKPVSACNPQLPPGLDAVLDRALAKDRTLRYQTAHEFAVALRDAARQARTDGAAAATAARPASGGASAAPGLAPALSRYDQLQSLGTGHAGTVHEALDHDTGRTVAIKAVRREYRPELAWVKSCFPVDAENARQLHHPHIVEIHEICSTPDTDFIVMERVDGQSLQRLLDERRRLAFDDTLKIMRELLSALGHAHAHGVVHHDIKPGNVLLDREGSVKLVDFCRLQVEDVGDRTCLQPQESVQYFSPEQVGVRMGTQVDFRTDLFSAGSLLYRMLTGTPPFIGTNGFSVMQAIEHEAHAPPSTLHPGLPPGIDAVLDRALAKRADDRFADAEAFAQALQAVALRRQRPPT